MQDLCSGAVCAEAKLEEAKQRRLESTCSNGREGDRHPQRRVEIRPGGEGSRGIGNAWISAVFEAASVDAFK